MSGFISAAKNKGKVKVQAKAAMLRQIRVALAVVNGDLLT